MSLFAFTGRATPPVTLLLLRPLARECQNSSAAPPSPSNSSNVQPPIPDEPTHLICHVQVPSISVTASATSNSHGKIDLLYFQLTVITRSRSLPHKNEIGKCIQCPMKKAGFLTTGFSCQVEYPSPFSVGAALHRSVLGDLMSITSCLTRFFSLSH